MPLQILSIFHDQFKGYVHLVQVTRNTRPEMCLSGGHRAVSLRIEKHTDEMIHFMLKAHYAQAMIAYTNNGPRKCVLNVPYNYILNSHFRIIYYSSLKSKQVACDSVKRPHRYIRVAFSEYSQLICLMYPDEDFNPILGLINQFPELRDFPLFLCNVREPLKSWAVSIDRSLQHIAIFRDQADFIRGISTNIHRFFFIYSHNIIQFC